MRKRVALPALRCLVVFTLALVVIGCASKPPRVGLQVPRKGDEIMVAGQLFHTGAPVVLWTDPGGYDAYRTERRFAPWRESSYQATTQAVRDIDAPNRYGVREQVLTDEELEQVRGGGWPLELLQEKVDQFVIHYDVCGTSRTCFKVLHDVRGLSVQFMLDLDGTIYQTCDLKERAWHATKSNPRSVGIEIANMGAYQNPIAVKEWYETRADGKTYITIPPRFGDGGIRDKSVVLKPIRDEMVSGPIHGETYRQYDLTAQQYESLTKLTATLCTVLPRITCDYPRDTGGGVVTTNLSDDQWTNYTGVLGHYHVQRNKQDPGPAFQWDRVIGDARKLMSKEALAKNERMRGKAVAIRTDRGTGARPATAPVTRGQPTTNPG
jgi:N-acetyl-anhydromuramyl-L-alanine amidase AmpD